MNIRWRRSRKPGETDCRQAMRDNTELRRQLTEALEELAEALRVAVEKLEEQEQ